jgi:hypothetical protein
MRLEHRAFAVTQDLGIPIAFSGFSLGNTNKLRRRSISQSGPILRASIARLLSQQQTPAELHAPPFVHSRSSTTSSSPCPRRLHRRLFLLHRGTPQPSVREPRGKARVCVADPHALCVGVGRQHHGPPVGQAMPCTARVTPGGETRASSSLKPPVCAPGVRIHSDSPDTAFSQTTNYSDMPTSAAT